jgi:hypothetical protein
MSANHPNTTKTVERAFVCFLLTFASRETISAHEGPPFPILVDQPVAGYLVSVWADPDLGTGTFYIMTDPADDRETVPEPDVELWVQPTSKRLSKVSYNAEREAIRNRIQFAAYPEFDALEMWTIGVRITPPGQTTVELTTEVEVTPPGLGAWDLLIYLFPFLLIGGMWALALKRRWNSMNTNQTMSHSLISNAGGAA